MPDDPKKAKGKALRRSDKELDRLSQIKRPDIDRSRDDWKAKAPDGSKNLIEADEL